MPRAQNTEAIHPRTRNARPTAQRFERRANMVRLAGGYHGEPAVRRGEM
jgi:hypothetical protein